MVIMYKWYIRTIKETEMIRWKIIWIIIFGLDILLLPLKIIIIPIMMLTKRGRKAIIELGSEIMYGCEER